MNTLYSQYCSDKPQAAVARMLTIYIEEAHAVDEWVLPESEVQKKQVNIKAHATLQERMTAAAAFVTDSNIESEVVVDSMQAGNVADVYWAWPERLYIILDGLVVYQGVSFCFLPHTHTHTHTTQHSYFSFPYTHHTTPHQGGLGPFDYKLQEVQAWLAERYGERGEKIEYK